MRTRRSPRNQDILWRALTPPVEHVAITPKRDPWLDMTPEQIDRTYYAMGKADRTRLKREAELERMRERNRAILSQESQP